MDADRARAHTARLRVPIFAIVLLVTGLVTARSAHAQIVLLDGAIAGFVGQTQQGHLDQPTPITSWSEFLTFFGGDTSGLANPYLAPSVQAFFDNGGERVWIVRTAAGDDAALIGGAAAGGQPARGLGALAGIDEVGVVAIPGATSRAIHVALLAHCESLADRVCLLDPASRDDVAAVQAERSGLASPAGHGTLWFPWVEAAPAGTPLELPPSGFVAGVIARTDAAAGPWESPAGPTRGPLLGATGLTYDVSTAEQDLLNPQGIDLLRSFPTTGPIVYGARTLSSDPEWRYLAVRRLATHVRESIEEGTRYALSEPNDALL